LKELNLEPSNKPSWVTRILTVGFLAFLGYLVIESFFKASPAFAISAGILIVLALMTVLVLSEAFNSFSIGKLLTLSREVSKTSQEKQELKTDNTELRKALVQLAVNVHQSQVNATINTSGVDLLKALGVVKADKPDEDLEQEAKSSPVAEAPALAQDRESRMQSFRIRRLADDLALEKYIDANALPRIDVERKIQFSSSFENLDPIMERRVTFDGYMRSANKEYFFEVRNEVTITPMFWDRLYVMLSKILFYREAKKVPTELILILSKLPTQEAEYESRNLERFMQAFQPAIAGGLLRVERIEISPSELEALSAKALTEQNA
jgi:hypothetical protein